MNKETKISKLAERIVELIISVILLIVIFSSDISGQIRLFVLIALGINLLFSVFLLLRTILSKKEVIKEE